MKKMMLAVFMAITLTTALHARERQLFDHNWLFMLADSTQMSQPGYHDGAWRRLDLPHDWAIEGDFRADNPSGASGGALPGGIGWYRKHFAIPAEAAADARFYLAFDGVYMNSTVWVNGHELGTRPYGYSSFEYDITPYVRRGADNVVAVRIDNSDQPNSRWYSGCGIYRHVWLTTTAPLHVAQWGVHAVTDAKGNVKVTTQLSDNRPTADQVRRPVIRQVVTDAQGKVVAQRQGTAPTQQLKVGKPRLWGVAQPNLYRLTTQVIVDGSVVDEVTTRIGFRDCRFDAKTGFWLNGKPLKINGVCMHHDLGSLGAALNEDALHRQLKTMRDMGANAIRCSHNPPAPELLNMCDTMGLLVMDESFDMWRRKKTKNDYARFFDEWHERDLADLIRRDRNHPSIFMWSIGNEVLEQWSSADADELTLEQANLILNAGHDQSMLAHTDELSPNSLLTRHLANIVHQYETTRPITAGCNEPDPKNHLFKSGAIDVIGFNYHHEWVKDVPRNFPGKPFLLSESVSALQTRGFYMMPSDSIFKAPKEWWMPYTDPTFMCSAYDNMHASWSATHEATWDVVKHNDFVAGQFIWTGFDYIGEPTPYGFPARSSYFGIVDLAGLPKDIYYMYQSEWTDRHVLHLFPHWSWLEGQTIDLWCYYNHADEVELFVNGKSQGVRSKDDHHYHVMWRVAYEPGEVKVVARKGGRVVNERVMHTPGAPAQVRLQVNYDGRRENATLEAGKPHLVFVEAEVTDADGILCPWADHQLHFTATGATIVGVDNGLQTSMERFKDNKRKAFMGKCIVVLQPTADHFELKAEAIGLKSATLF